MTFIPNPKLVKSLVAELRAKQPGGGFITPDDIKLIVSMRKWANAPAVGEFKPNNQFLIWEAVEKELQL